MKKIMLVLYLVCSYINILAQEKKSIPQWSVKPVISVPKFIDSLKFVNAIRKNEVLKIFYLSLKKDTSGSVYQYAFYVDVKGKVIPAKPEVTKYFEPIDKFVENVFLDYKWRPAHRLGCRSCFVKTFGILSFDFDTDRNQILCVIRINNEREYKIFNHKIIIK